MGLNFNYTCPDINSAITTISDEVSSIKDSLNSLEYVANQELERIRTLNSDLREQAEWQIEGLEDTISPLKSENKDLRNDLEELREKVKDLEAEIIDKNERISYLESSEYKDEIIENYLENCND